MVIAFIKVDVLGRANMIELSVVRSRQQFNSVSHKVSVELHEQSYERQVVWRDVSL